MTIHFLACLIFVFAVGCFNPSSGVDVATNNNLGNKIVEEGSPTKLGITTGDLAGTEIELSSGSLAVGSNVSVDLADVPSAFKDHDGVSEASSALSVTATDADGNLISESTNAMTLKIPVQSAEAGLALFEVEKTEQNLCVFLDADDDSFYVWRSSAFTVSAGYVVFESTRFGIYQLYYCGDETIDESVDAASSGIAGSFNSGGDNGGEVATATDSTPPATPTLLDDKDRHGTATSTPTITWGAVSDSDLSHYELAIGSVPGAQDIVDWTNVGNKVTHQFSGLTALDDGKMYYATVRAVDSAGNASDKANADGWQQLVCPEHYVKVEGNTTTGLGGSSYTAGTKTVNSTSRAISDFCMMKYEARNNSGASSDPSDLTLWVSLNRAAAVSACTALGSDYYLTQNNFWQAVAREVANNDNNWTEGDVSNNSASNQLFVGHMDTSSGPFDACAENVVILGGTSSDCTTLGSAAERTRRHILNSGEYIWDLSGNVEEWISDNAESVSNGQDVKDLNASDSLIYGSEIDHTSKDATSKGGLGVIANSGTAVARGGNLNNGTSAGVFTTSYNSPVTTGSTIGFRCIYAP